MPDMADAPYDTVIAGARWFDGTGAPSAVRHLGIRDGHVVAVSPDPLDTTGCSDVVDADGKWVLPGMVDIHTHYDVEVLVGPALEESVRHGVTTTFLGSCSLSTVHVGGVDAGDLFGRVEAIPRRHVIRAVDEHQTWTTADEYVAALESLPLGPNLAAFIGHSDMRTATMGLDRATRKEVSPTPGRAARGWRRCSPRRSTPASSGCRPSSCSSTSSTATSAARARCPRRTRSARR